MSQQVQALTDSGAYAERLAPLAARGTEAVAEIVDLTISSAARLAASDVHLEPASRGMLVRFRLDGVMQDFGAMPLKLAPNIVARCKVMAGLLSYRMDIPQEGGAPGEAYGPGIQLRVSTFPTLHGERVAIRIFNPEARREGLSDLGLSASVRECLEKALASPEGLILISGPSGSGKTTSLYACLDHILTASSGRRNVVTVEDPIENEIPGVTQTAVNRVVGLTFASSLHSLLRQNPEVIMVGEVRDPETAHIIVEAALTGHLVLSTVHAPRAAIVAHRLLDMGVEPYGLAGALSLVIAQRLVRRLCEKCSRPACEEEKRNVPESARPKARTAAGCEACHGTGYRGRALVAEKLSASDELHDAIMERAPRRCFVEIASREKENIETMAWRMVADGHTSGDEVRRVLAGGTI